MQTQNETETEGRYDDAFTASSTDRLVAVGLLYRAPAATAEGSTFKRYGGWATLISDLIDVWHDRDRELANGRVASDVETRPVD
ncbi:hypothetical protein RIB2604_01708550 [Aspergillus luchuensis]|uniref:Uncharacterized protein n=1 Tax=Aspergillus kawachii TaxID=1069201 RepID=A0A146FCW0_ASPKA|nr:hypothetical protein RIB2604_01708550 [Aspergillus luchuensis]